MRFLLVEDSRPTRNLIKNYVGELDIGREVSFLETETGETALEMLGQNHIDFVFLDWNLSSKMTGLDVLKIMRKQEKFKQIPVIMVTSESGKPDVIEALKCGANDFTVKPIDKKVFSEKVLKIAMSILF
ncbi:MAG: response regulator [Treponema sp.]|nr:response regulator [Treponema sp.]